MSNDKTSDECENKECSAWRTVAVESNKALSQYLRDHGEPKEHYGMPVDGVRHVVNQLEQERDQLKHKERHLLDVYKSLGLKWGDDPFCVIEKLQSQTT